MNLGLTYYEAKALETIVYTSSTAKEISKKANIPPGKVYSVLKSLLGKQHIVQTNNRPKQYYIPDVNALVTKLIESKQEESQYIYAKARDLALQSSKLHNTSSPFFQLGVTVEDNKNIQLRSFREAKKEICQILNIHHKPKSNRTSKLQWEKEIQTATQRGVHIRAIYPTIAILPLLLQQLPEEKFTVKRLDLDFMRCDIIDEKKVLLKLVHSDPLNFGGIVFIEDEKFAKNLKRVFEQFWNEAE